MFFTLLAKFIFLYLRIMQKQFFAFLLLIALIGSCCSRFFIYAGFEVNKDYIAKTLCVNVSKPWMHCNGKCYFKKKVQQAEQNEKNEAAKERLSSLSLSFFHNHADISFQPALTKRTLNILVFKYSCNYNSLSVGSVFHPPKSA